MNREQMIGQVAGLIVVRQRFDDTARAILDAVLPQVTTAEELEALPKNSVVLSDAHVGVFERWAGVASEPWRSGSGMYWTSREIALKFAPLTVVWRPES